MALRIEIEAWDPEYGSSMAASLEPTDATIDDAVELPPADWRPIAPPAELPPAPAVAFVDGVRRIDAMVWLVAEDGSARRGICASYAAGVVHAGERARIEAVEVRRGLFAPRGAVPLPTDAGTFAAIPVTGEELDALSLALQERLGALEIEVATAVGGSAGLIVVDGPLSGRQNVPGALGYVKTHRVSYLGEGPSRVVARLAPGERSPLFLTRTSWTRWSWYLRLPGPARHPWAGIVRLEAATARNLAEAQRLADLSAVTLPRYASVPHKEPRAPQNLFPIGGLERELRHRLGDAAFVHRALRLAAAGASPSLVSAQPGEPRLGHDWTRETGGTT